MLHPAHIVKRTLNLASTTECCREQCLYNFASCCCVLSFSATRHFGLPLKYVHEIRMCFRPTYDISHKFCPITVSGLYPVLNAKVCTVIAIPENDLKLWCPAIHTEVILYCLLAKLLMVSSVLSTRCEVWSEAPLGGVSAEKQSIVEGASSTRYVKCFLLWLVMYFHVVKLHCSLTFWRLSITQTFL